MRQVSWALLLLAAAVGCGDGGAEAPDAQAPEADLASPFDATPPDLASAGDDLGSTDALPVTDALTPAADLAPIADLAPSTGLDWPSDRSFPRFSAVDALDVIDVSALHDDEKNVFATLEGVVNRVKPRVYLLDNFGEGKRFWLDKLGATQNPVADPYTLIAKYRSELTGVVITDDAVSDTVNLATTIAGVKRAVVASPALAATLMAAPYSLPAVADLRTNHFASKVAVYDYGLSQFGAQVSHRLLCGISPSVSGYVVTMQGGWLPYIHDNSILNGTLPLVRLVQTYADDEAGLESGIDNGAKFWTHTGPAFLAVQGNMNSGAMSPTAFYNAVQHYAANADYVFVRPDHFFQLFREANNLTINP